MFKPFYVVHLFSAHGMNARLNDVGRNLALAKRPVGGLLYPTPIAADPMPTSHIG